MQRQPRIGVQQRTQSMSPSQRYSRGLEYRCDGDNDCGDFTDESIDICLKLVMTKYDDGDGDECDQRLELR